MTTDSSTDGPVLGSQVPEVPRKTVGQHLLQDAIRVLPLFAVGTIMIYYSPAIALWLDAPPLAAYGLVIGGVFMIIAFSHIARRLLAPTIDLPALGLVASQTSIGAAVVFLSICYLLGKIIEIMGTAIQLR